jgi:protein-S-isoprenylcysteine O-methyltransferase Ste14
MATSRSTARLRLTAVLLFGVLALVAVSERSGASGLAGEALQLTGLACLASAALGRIWASVFIAGFKDARLVREGPYAVLRHPLYALSMVAMLGVGLATRSLAITAALVAAFGVIYLSAARAEDHLLHALHGDEFERFRAERRAFVPHWSAYRVPETLEIRPRVLWKAFLDAGSLLGYYALLRLADALQLAGTTPTWLALP